MKQTGAARVVLALLCLMYLIMYVNRTNISTAAPLMKTDLALSNTQLGLVFSAFAVPYALFQLVGGWTADKFGPRLTLSVCCALVGLSTILTSAARGFVSLLVLRVALGFGEGPAFPAATRAISAWIPTKSWGGAQGAVHASARLGNALTPPLMGALLLAISWRGSFAVLGLASLVWLCLWAWYFRNRPPGGTGIAEGESAARSPVPWRRLAPRILPVTIVNFCYGWTLWMFLSWIPAFFFENYRLNLQSSALFAGGVFFAGVIGDAAGGLATDRLLHMTGDLRLARRSVIITGFLGAFVFLVPVMAIHDVRIAAAGLSLAFFFVELTVAPMWSIPMDIAPRYAGSASGIMNFGFGVAGLVSPSVFGYLVDQTGGWVVSFIGSVALLLSGAVLAMGLRPDKKFLDAGEV